MLGSTEIRTLHWPMSARLPSLLELFADPHECAQLTPDRLRERLKGAGVGSRALRLHAEIGDALVAPLADLICRSGRTDARQEVLAFLRLVQAGEMDVPPPRQMVAALSRLQLPRPTLGQIPPYLFRALWKETAQRCYRSEPVDGWLREEALPLIEWFVQTDQDASTDANRRRASWCQFEARWEDWAYSPGQPNGTRSWDAVMRRFETGPFLALELHSERALHEEGVAMKHCVADWVGMCLRDAVHIFSLRERKSLTRLATLAVSPNDTLGWQCVQLKGVRNAAVTGMVAEFAAMLLDQLDRCMPCIDEGL